MKLLENIFYALFALVLILYGLSKFYPFMPTPEVPAKATAYIGALMATGYLWYFIGIVEIIGGLLIFVPRFRLLGALLLLPIVVNIALYLLLLAKTVPGIFMSAFLITIELVIFWKAREILSGLIGSENKNENI